MTEPKYLLLPLELVQRLATADRDAFDVLLAAVTDYKTLITTQGAAARQVTGKREVPQDSVDALVRLGDRIGMQRTDDVARQVELPDAAREAVVPE